ncbi:unnamed protein product [Urochloa decumbens]|uniref:Uncharacterized protein n=1 Tax=Urochloa decumbens TaxID=240449 RepID=A0ABC9ARB4_9POAL
MRLRAGREDARAAVALGDVLGDAERGEAGGAAVEVEQRAAHGRPEPEELGQADVCAGLLGAGIGADHEVGDVGRRASPSRDRPRRCVGGEVVGGDRADGLPSAERRCAAVDYLRVDADHLLGVVEVALLDARVVACVGIGSKKSCVM